MIKTLDRGRKFKEERDLVETHYKQNMFLKDYNSFFSFLFFFEMLFAIYSENFLYEILL